MGDDNARAAFKEGSGNMVRIISGYSAEFIRPAAYPKLRPKGFGKIVIIGKGVIQPAAKVVLLIVRWGNIGSG